MSLFNRDYEFEAELEDHPLGNQNIYRLYYMDYHRFGEGYGMGPDNVAVTDYPSKPFMIPGGMSREDAFKVLSYLTDFIEKQQNLRPCSLKSVSTLDSILDLQRLGFRRINVDNNIDDSDVIDLFTVSGRLLLFKKSEKYQKYFEWYTEGITFDEVKQIYSKCNIEFYDLILSENTEDSKTENLSAEDPKNDNLPEAITFEEALDIYLEQFKMFAQENPETAQIIAFKNLQNFRVIDETGALTSPYSKDENPPSGPRLIKK